VTPSKLAPGTFCYYCQQDFGTKTKLIKHIERLHPNTYAYWSYVPEDRWPKPIESEL
jgi:hypothetical protein